MERIQMVDLQNHYLVIKGDIAKVLSGDETITTNTLEVLKVVDIIERIYNK